jgi:hypothetical protein
MGRRAAKSILNEDAYPLARKGLHNYKVAAGETGGVIELLLLWFDEMMFRLFDGEKFAPQDAVRFFGGGRTTKASRERRHSAAL